MEFMEVQYVLVMSLIRFFGSWAIVLGQSCSISSQGFLLLLDQHNELVWKFDDYFRYA